MIPFDAAVSEILGLDSIKFGSTSAKFQHVPVENVIVSESLLVKQVTEELNTS